uniref:Fibronectin type-III domain-containing protein n=2 Tax=Wuchereria bancrofti TaxID=6293 RepID=A0AAF5PVB2_WUCBA
MLLLALLLSTYLAMTNGVTSQQAKCLIDCYVKCLNIGLLNATQCSCNTANNQKLCSIDFDESVIQSSMTNDVVPVKTEYLNSRNIRIEMNDNRINAFVYIFEYSTVSTAPDNWIFAGASSSPSITFAIEDACRDYQFRVIVILKNEDIDRWLIVYRPRIIPVDLPTFAITPDKIQTVPPVYNADDGTVVVYISWENPTGYTDEDIYGYEGPAIYPVQCNSPEAELPSPSVELKEGGGRLRISLPSEVLDSKCRVWAEVQMLPRCIRLEPFSIQQSFELNCDKLKNLEVCKHEIAPQCTDVIDIWGYGSNATIMWSPQDNFGTPLYYHIRYGPAKMQGIPPLASWTIASLHEIKTIGNSTTLQLHIVPDIDYGIQICAVYSEHRKQPKFELMRVIPFICTSCKITPAESFGRCGECTKIEGPLLLGRRCHPKGGIGCTLAGTISNISDIKDDDILRNPLTVLPSDVFIDSPHDSTKTKINDRQSIPLIHENSNTLIPQSSTNSTTKLQTSLTESEAQIIEQSADEFSINENKAKETTTLHNNQGAFVMSNSRSAIEVPTSAPQLSQTVTAPNKEKLQSDLTSCTLFNGVICEFGCIDQTKCNCPQGTRVLMDNGACLSQSNHRSPPFVCLSTTDVKAIWNPWIHTLQIQSKKIYNEIKMHTNYDRIFLEFGHIKHIAKGQISSNEVIFDERNEKSNKVVIRTNKILQSGLFLTAPYSFYTNQTIEPLIYQYGLRICAFNNSEIQNPFAVDWTRGNGQSVFHLNAIQFERDHMRNIVSNEQKQITRMAFVIVPIILIVLLVFLLAVVIYMNCARLKRCYDRRKTRHFRPFVWNGDIPPMMTNGTVHEKKHSSVITKSAF